MDGSLGREASVGRSVERRRRSGRGLSIRFAIDRSNESIAAVGTRWTTWTSRTRSRCGRRTEARTRSVRRCARTSSRREEEEGAATGGRRRASPTRVIRRLRRASSLTRAPLVSNEDAEKPPTDELFYSREGQAAASVLRVRWSCDQDEMRGDSARHTRSERTSALRDGGRGRREGGTDGGQSARNQSSSSNGRAEPPLGTKK